MPFHDKLSAFADNTKEFFSDASNAVGEATSFVSDVSNIFTTEGGTTVAAPVTSTVTSGPLPNNVGVNPTQEPSKLTAPVVGFGGLSNRNMLLAGAGIVLLALLVIRR